MARFIFIAVLVVIASSSFSSGKRLRPYRHLSQSQENHKPIFVNCSSYAPEIMEEEPAGTVVIEVRAEDRDLPEEGGTVTYRLLKCPGDKPKFEINDRTGLIRTTRIFDRDYWPGRTREEYVTVLASDNGQPRLDDVCTFKVPIKDINDNAPVFDNVLLTQRYYNGAVTQDMLVNEKVMHISATDIDDRENSVVVYSLSAEKQDDGAYFRIDNPSGVISLAKKIDKEVGYTFSLTARAQDLGDDPKYRDIGVNIRVVESYKKAPSFLSAPQEPIKLPENFDNFDSRIFKLEVASNIAEYPEVLFLLAIRDIEKTNSSNTFSLDSEGNVTYIKLQERLDYETSTEYTLTVQAVNQYMRIAEIVFKIKVLDVNEYIPHILGCDEYAYSSKSRSDPTVREHEPAGVPVMQVRAFDEDATSAHNQININVS